MSKYSKQKAAAGAKPTKPVATDRSANLPSGMRIRFTSDWHVGEGVGRHNTVDRIIKRHAEDGLPYLPAKTLTGMLRDAAERVARGLDEAVENGPWSGLVQQVFGGEKPLAAPGSSASRPAAIYLTPARLPQDLRRVLTSDQGRAIAQSLSLIKPGVRLDPNTGTAMPDHLRMEEMAVADMELAADLTYAADLEKASPELRRAVHALLWAACRSLERLGGKRRRGAGCCVCSLTSELTSAMACQILETTPDTAFHFPWSLPKLGAMQPYKEERPEWQVFKLRLQLLTPVLVPHTVAGNQVTGQDFIPGTLLLAALNSRLNGWLGPDRKLSALAAGALQISHAYPALGDHRLLPLPLALVQPKQGGDAHTYLNSLKELPPKHEQHKPRQGVFVSPRSEGGHHAACTVLMQTATHATINDERQRPTEDVGGVYTYQAIAAHQSFVAELRLHKSLLPKADISLFNGRYRLGRSKKDDYGLVELSACRSNEAVPLLPKGLEGFSLWLTSPLLIRNTRLQASTNLADLERHLSEELGCLVTATPVHLRSQRDDGWQTRWQASRPSRMGFAAGSCFAVKRRDAGLFDPVKLMALQAAGLGERRGEGYGELRIEAPMLQQEKIHLGAAPSPGPAPAAATAVAGEFWPKLLKRHWQGEIQRRTLLLALDPTFRATTLAISSGDSNSQLGNLRACLEMTSPTSGDSALLERLAGGDAGHSPTTAAAPCHSAVHCRQHFHQPQQVWDWLEQRSCGGPLPNGGDAEQGAALKSSLARQALRLIWLAALQAEIRARANAAGLAGQATPAPSTEEH